MTASSPGRSQMEEHQARSSEGVLSGAWCFGRHTQMNGEVWKEIMGVGELYVNIVTDPKTFNFGEMFGDTQPKPMEKGLLRLH
jgi:hypothetical protein